MFIFTKISLIIFSILTIDLIAEALGIIDPKHSNYVFIAGMIVQIMMFIFLIIIVLIKKRELKNGIKIIRHKIEDKLIKGGVEILPEFMIPTNPRKASVFKIFVEVRDFKEPPYFGILKMGRGNVAVNDIKKHLLGVRAGIIEGSFVFDADIIVRPDEKINFKFKDDTNVKMLFVGELYIP